MTLCKCACVNTQIWNYGLGVQMDYWAAKDDIQKQLLFTSFTTLKYYI